MNRVSVDRFSKFFSLEPAHLCHLSVRRSGSFDPVGTLQSADVGDDIQNIALRHALDCRHVAEFPVMRPDAVLRRQDKSHVAVVAGLIDLMHQRGCNAVLPLRVDAMAGCADCIISARADLFLFRET